MGPWLRASSRTNEALRNATAFLGPEPADTIQAGQDKPSAPAARALDIAAAALTTGRDLLHTHLATRPGGDLLARSEWAPVLTSPGVTRAMLRELATCARQIAPAAAISPSPGHLSAAPPKTGAGSTPPASGSGSWTGPSRPPTSTTRSPPTTPRSYTPSP